MVGVACLEVQTQARLTLGRLRQGEMTPPSVANRIVKGYNPVSSERGN